MSARSAGCSETENGQEQGELRAAANKATMFQPVCCRGQPIHDGKEYAEQRGNVLWGLDRDMPLRFSHENPDIKALYAEYLGKPLSERSHHLLHTDINGWDMPKQS